MQVAAVILCGGESRRMGRPKAWLPFGAEYLLQRVVRLASAVAAPIAVVAAPGQELPPLPGSVIIARDPQRGRGPLEGLAAGLAALPGEADLVYATATDVPFLQPSWIERMAELIGGHDLAIPRCDGFFHPLAALYRKEAALPATRALLQADRLRPVFLSEILRTRIVAAEELRDVDPELATLRNLNSPEDYELARKAAGLNPPDHPPAAGEPRPRHVTLEFYGVPRLRAGVGRIEVDADHIAAALGAACRACPGLRGTVISEAGALHAAYILNLNGRQFTNDPSTHLADGDVLLVLSVDAGG